MVKIGAMPDANTIENLLAQFKQAVGEKEFARVWAEVRGNEEQPGWLGGRTANG